MSEDVWLFERERRRASRKTAITPDEAVELRHLYDELPVISAAAAEALSVGGGVAGLASTRFAELDDRVVDIIGRIKEILG